MIGTQSCQGIYVIDSAIKEAVLMSSSRVPSDTKEEFYFDQKFCAWYITAEEGRAIQLRFDYFFTECFWDTVTIFDGPDNSYPMIGKLCGNRDNSYGYSDIIVSTGNHLTIVFQSDADIVARGFRALSQQIDPIPMNSTAFTPRMFHSSAYDSDHDIVYNSFGLSNGAAPQQDLVLYFPQNDSFVKRHGWSISPPARYAHFSWFVDSKLIIFGGIRMTYSFLDYLNDIWSYDPDVNLWTKLASHGDNTPPGLEDPAAILVETALSKLIYVIGGRYKSRYGNTGSRALYSYNLATGVWTALANAPAAVWGATITYHQETATLHLIGGFFSTYNPSLMDEYPSYQYSIKNDAWNTQTLRDPSKALVYSSAQTFDRDYAIIFGGMYTKSISWRAPLEDCFSNVVSIYNFACQSFTYYYLKESEKRAGHSMILRSDTILVFGGSDGLFQDSVLKIPVPLLNKTNEEQNKCKSQNYCKTFTDCYDCLLKPYCGWCPDQCVLDDFSLINITNHTVNTCPDQTNIQNSVSICPIANMAQLNLPLHHIIHAPDRYADFQVYVDSPTYGICLPIQDIDLLAIVSDIKPQNTLVNITVPYLKLKTVQLSENAGILLPATDLRRISGVYYFRVSPFVQNMPTHSTDYSPISFTIKFTVASPVWTPHEPENGWTNLDYISLAVVLAVSLTLTVIMTVFIIRARRRLLTMQNWQNRIEYTEEVSTYKPELYSAMMRLPVNGLKFSGRDVPLAYSEISLASQRKFNEGWFKSIPKLIRRFTASQVNIDVNSKTIYPLSIEKMPLGRLHNRAYEIVGISFLVVNPGYERTVRSGCIPNVSIGTSLHRRNSSYRSLRSMVANYLQNNTAS